MSSRDGTTSAPSTQPEPPADDPPPEESAQPQPPADDAPPEESTQPQPPADDAAFGGAGSNPSRPPTMLPSGEPELPQPPADDAPPERVGHNPSRPPMMRLLRSRQRLQTRRPAGPRIRPGRMVRCWWVRCLRLSRTRRGLRFCGGRLWVRGVVSSRSAGSRFACRRERWARRWMLRLGLRWAPSALRWVGLWSVSTMSARWRRRSSCPGM